MAGGTSGGRGNRQGKPKLPALVKNAGSNAHPFGGKPGNRAVWPVLSWKARLLGRVLAEPESRPEAHAGYFLAGTTVPKAISAVGDELRVCRASGDIDGVAFYGRVLEVLRRQSFGGKKIDK